MPFTLSHAAAVIPINQKFREYLPLSALVVGSFSPDFKYFFPFTRLGIFSHSITGIFLFCLPISLLVLWLFHTLVKEPLHHLTPKSFQRRLVTDTTKLAFLPIKNFVAIVLAIIIGAFTHIFWDSFTHEYGWAVEYWPVLNSMVSHVWTYDLQVFALLQHLSTIIGLGLLANWFWRWLRQTPDEERIIDPHPVQKGLGERYKIGVWIFLIGLSLSIGLAQGIIKSQRSAGMVALEIFVVQAVIGWMFGAVVAVLLYSLLFKWVVVGYLKD